jgi:hypothetical protein
MTGEVLSRLVLLAPQQQAHVISLSQVADRCCDGESSRMRWCGVISRSLTPASTERNPDDDEGAEMRTAERARSYGMDLDHLDRAVWPPQRDERAYPAVVHQATGRLMARFSIDPAEALARLHELATGLNRPLNEVAQDVALGYLRPDDHGVVSDLGPTADADLALLRHHLVALRDGADDTIDGADDPATL